VHFAFPAVQLLFPACKNDLQMEKDGSVITRDGSVLFRLVRPVILLKYGHRLAFDWLVQRVSYFEPRETRDRNDHQHKEMV